MKILCIGGSGNISASVVKLGLSRGHEIMILNRHGDKELEALGARHIPCDINEGTQLKDAVAGLDIDVAMDFICFTPEQARRDYEAFCGRVRQFIFISSCTVYQKPCLVTPITEDVPLKNPYSDYARNKIACELYFLERYREDDFPVTIVRPSHTYGETKLVVGPLMGWQVPHWTFAQRILDGKPIVVHDTGRSLWTMTHSDDIAVGIVGLAGNIAAIGHAFHITNEMPMTWNEVMETYGWLLGRKVEMVHIPTEYIKKRDPAMAEGIYGDMSENGVFDNSKIRRFVPEYDPKITLREGLARSLRWYDAHPEAKVVDADYDRWTDALIAAWQQV